MTGRLFLLLLCLVLQVACHVVVASAMDESEAVVPSKARILESRINGGEAVVPTKMRNLESRIVGGVKADPKRHPYFTQLGISFQSSSSAYIRSCGGTLIASDVVLTSAQCLFPTSPGDKVLKIYAWVNSTSIYESPYEYYRTTTRFVRHQFFNSTVYTNNIALVFLDARVTGVTLAKTNKIASSPVVGKALYAIGLGLLNSSPEVEATYLMSVSVNTLSPNACSKFFSVGFTNANQICAGGAKNICNGDGGGPLVIHGTSASTDVQVGIVSYGLGGGCGKYPSAFTRVSKYATWITSNICKYSKFKPSTCA